jgi:hypothetical protein
MIPLAVQEIDETNRELANIPWPAARLRKLGCTGLKIGIEHSLMPPLGKQEISFSTKRRRSWKIEKTEGKLAPYRASRAPHCLKRYRHRRPWVGAWSCYLLTRSNMAEDVDLTQICVGSVSY